MHFGSECAPPQHTLEPLQLPSTHSAFMLHTLRTLHPSQPISRRLHQRCASSSHTMRCNHAACNTEQGPCHPTEHIARHAQYQRSHLRPCTHLCPQKRHQKLLHTKKFVQLVFWHQQYYPNVMCARCPPFNNKVHLTKKPGHRVSTAAVLYLQPYPTCWRPQCQRRQNLQISFAFKLQPRVQQKHCSWGLRPTSSKHYLEKTAGSRNYNNQHCTCAVRLAHNNWNYLQKLMDRMLHYSQAGRPLDCKLNLLLCEWRRHPALEQPKHLLTKPLPLFLPCWALCRHRRAQS